MRSTSLLLACLALPAAGAELQCYGRADEAQATVTCVNPAEVLQITAEVRHARLYVSDSRTTLRKVAALLVDCAGRRAFGVDGIRLDDAEFNETARAICAAPAKQRRAP